MRVDAHDTRAKQSAWRERRSPDLSSPPVASLGLFPYTFCAGEAIQLYDFSYDPGQVGIASRMWDFGDGTNAGEQCPSHRYTVAGSYVVTLKVTTVDGRTASISQPLDVRPGAS